MELNKRIAAIPLPIRMQRLPVSGEGYPVPWFVAEVNGKPDFRCSDDEKIRAAIRFKRCWLCGELLGRYITFVIGPMSAVNRTSSEPPSHHECATYAARACPFLSQPRMRRNEKELPEDRSVAGIAIKRNPGVALLWTTRSYRLVRGDAGGAGGAGVLFRIGLPEKTEWYCEGRPATRAEVMASFESGLPVLQQIAKTHDGPDGVADLERMVQVALQLVPA
jgi:hypothetical protein